MKRALQSTFIAAAFSIFVGIAGVLSLLSYSVAQSVALPSSLKHIGADIERVQDIAVVKKVCATLVNVITTDLTAHDDLVWWGLGFMVLSGVFCGMLSTYAYISLRRLRATQADYDEPTARPELPFSLPAVISKANSGQLELWKAFWLLFVPGAILVPIAVFSLYATIKNFSLVSAGNLADFFITPLLISAVWLWYAGLSVLLWRSSTNTDYQVLGLIVRIAIGLSIAVPILRTALVLSYLG